MVGTSLISYFVNSRHLFNKLFKCDLIGPRKKLPVTLACYYTVVLFTVFNGIIISIIIGISQGSIMLPTINFFVWADFNVRKENVNA